MSEFLDKLRAARIKPNSVKQKFRLEYDPRKAAVYGFFESTDDRAFYRDAIRFHAEGLNLFTYICDGKGGVYYARTFAVDSNKAHNTMFFADKDYDNLAPSKYVDHSLIFLTEHYSIENYMTSEIVLREVLETHICLPHDAQRYAKICQQLQQIQDAFYNLYRPLAARVIAYRRIGGSVEFGQHGDKLERCLNLDGGMPTPKESHVDAFCAACGFSSETLSSDDVARVEHELAQLNPRSWVRGKFDLWVFLDFVNELWEGLVGEHVSEKKKVKKTIHFDHLNVFSILGAACEIPTGLNDYIVARIG